MGANTAAPSKREVRRLAAAWSDFAGTGEFRAVSRFIKNNRSNARMYMWIVFSAGWWRAQEKRGEAEVVELRRKKRA